MKLTTTILAAVPALVITGSVLLGAGAASAAPGITPNGYAGAQNMINVHAKYQMEVIAMGHANANGDNGMWNAVLITTDNNPLP